MKAGPRLASLTAKEHRGRPHSLACLQHRVSGGGSWETGADSAMRAPSRPVNPLQADHTTSVRLPQPWRSHVEDGSING